MRHGSSLRFKCFTPSVNAISLSASTAKDKQKFKLEFIKTNHFVWEIYDALKALNLHLGAEKEKQIQYRPSR